MAEGRILLVLVIAVSVGVLGVRGQFIRPCSVFSWPIICCGDNYCSSPLENNVNCPADCSSYTPPPQASKMIQVIPNDVPNQCVGTTSGKVLMLANKGRV